MFDPTISTRATHRAASSFCALWAAVSLVGSSLVMATLQAQSAPATAAQGQRAVLDPVAEAERLAELAAGLKSGEAPIAHALRLLGDDVRVFDMHMSTLANPFMDGRVPGSHGMEVAKDYMEYWFKRAGVTPAFRDDQGRPTFRQPFPLGGGKLEIAEQALEVVDGETNLSAGADFTAIGLGKSGNVNGAAVFCGYGIDDGLNGYDGFEDGDDLSGKVAVVFRFEPMDEEGRSRFAKGRRPWSTKAGFTVKLRELRRRGAAAVVIINPPGCFDPRSERLMDPSEIGDSMFDGPVFHVTSEAGERLLAALSGTDQSLMAWRTQADAGRAFEPLPNRLRAVTAMERTKLFGENVGAILPGRGALADEIVVMGAHLDHLGMGYFGSRSGPGELHPGADDNASGSAAVLMLAEKLADDYAAMPESTPRRTMLFVGFSGEESGLNGSRFYTENPIAPLEQHAIMLNFDMIGRIVKQRLSVSGIGSAEGLNEVVEPIFDRSPLDVVASNGVAPNSDHFAFYQKRVPVLFAIIADFHAEYHTPKDVAWKVNRVGGVHTIHLFHDLLRTFATRTEPFVFQGPGGNRQRSGGADRSAGAGDASASGSGRGGVRVRFGIQPGTYEDGIGGIPVAAVSPESPAELGGVQAGDRLMTWNGAKIVDVGGWMQQLGRHKPGDKVTVGVDRNDKRIELEVTLGASTRRR